MASAGTVVVQFWSRICLPISRVATTFPPLLWKMTVALDDGMPRVFDADWAM
jgi:hypothetical protein